MSFALVQWTVRCVRKEKVRRETKKGRKNANYFINAFEMQRIVELCIKMWSVRHGALRIAKRKNPTRI